MSEENTEAPVDASREDDRNELIEDESPIPDPEEIHPGRDDEPEAD